MTISTTVNRVDVLGNGSATTFSFSPVVITQASDLAVWLLDNLGNQTLLTQGVGPSQYTVVVPTYPGTGSITYPGINGTVLPVGWQLTMKQRVPLLQQFQPQNQGPFLAGTYGNAYDYSILVSQHLDEKLSRAILAAETDVAGALSVPTLISRKNQVWGFDGNGNSIAVQPSSALVSVAMQPVVAASTLAAARALLGGLVLLTPQLFGAKGDATHDDTAAVVACLQAAIAVNGTAYLPACAGYKITTPINLANCATLTIRGDGAYPCTSRITPNFGSTLIGATGNGNCVIDASGASGVKFQGINIASIGISGASTIGVYLGASTVQNGSNCVFEDCAILLPATGSSVGIYGVSANLVTGRGLMIMADYCLYLTDTTAHGLNLNPPYGVWGANIQSDGCSFYGCMFLGYGTVVPLVLINCASHSYDQLYIVNINGGAGYVGQLYAMQLNGVTDIRMKVEIDYFPVAFIGLGAWFHVYLSGIIFQGTTPLTNANPVIGAFTGNEIEDCELNIRGITNFGAGFFTYSMQGGSSGSPALGALFNVRFWFNTAVAASAGFFNFNTTNAVPFFNCKFDGNADFTNGSGVTIEVSGSSAATSTYRLLVNSKIIGVA